MDNMENEVLDTTKQIAEKMKMAHPITKEPRSVWSLALDLAQVSYTVGKDSVTAIEPYDEAGDMAYVAWFNVWCGETLYTKVNSRFVSRVFYAPH